jgi:hypothetical protein
VIGAIQLINQPDNLVLLDEPDTHLIRSGPGNIQRCLQKRSTINRGAGRLF